MSLDFLLLPVAPSALPTYASPIQMAAQTNCRYLMGIPMQRTLPEMAFLLCATTPPLIWGIPFCFLWKTYQYDATPVAALAQDSSQLWDRDQVAAGGVDIPKNSNSCFTRSLSWSGIRRW